jgi:cysteinyl-tRNA synthetase
MTTIRLYNTRTRKKEDFAPLNSDDVRMYVCGPTVYDRAHLGNARPVIVFDVLFRQLRHVYGADHVTYVRNFTDVDDKINSAALARKEAGEERPLEELIRERSDETTQWFLEDMAALGTLPPTHMPRATAYIPQMVAMIKTLITKDHAYEAEGHVLFAVESYADYGTLSGRTIKDMIAGARVEVAPYKRNPMDFVLWKPSSGDLPGWPSPWGRGRPGWHIECSAMSRELLGENFDIHGGGNDLLFPHHENEIAQSVCANPGSDFAKVWMHNEMFQVDGQKMSKSLGNFTTAQELMEPESPGRRRVPGEVIRFVMLSTHYRKPMDWTERKRDAASKELAQWRTAIEGVASGDVSQAAVGALANDLNVNGVITELRRLFKVGETARLKATAELIGLLSDELEWPYPRHHVIHAGTGHYNSTHGTLLNPLESLLVKLREAAVKSNDFSKVDALKASLVDAGVEVRMKKDSVDLIPGSDFDPTKLKALK